MKYVPKIDGSAIEKVARAICKESGDKPDDLAPGDRPYDCFETEDGECKEVIVVDREDSNGRSFYVWRLYVCHAIAAMEAMGVNTFGRKGAPDYPAATPKDQRSNTNPFC